MTEQDDARQPPGVAALHLFVLAAFGIAQPLFDLLGRYPAFFAAHNVTRWGLVAFALVVLLALPLALTLLEGLAGLAGRRARAVVHLIFVGLLAAILALGIVRRFGWGSLPTFALAVLLGGLIAWAYQRTEGLRRGLTFLTVAPVLFLFLFLFTSNSASLVTSGAAKVYDAKATSRPPIVLVVFDAFGVQMLMDRRDHLDARRFPHFAEFLEQGTWYPNATTAHENTTYSVPAILDGNVPDKGAAPTVQAHPDNLFTLLGSTYDMDVSEEATNMCPSGCSRPNGGSTSDELEVLASDVSVVLEYLLAPDDLRDDLPSIDDRWRDFREIGTEFERREGVLARLAGGQRPDRFRGSVAAIKAEKRPTLDFMHVLLPHEPLEYLPSGKSYAVGEERDSSLDGPPSYDNAFLSDQAFQRHLLQVGYVDRLLGELIKRMKDQGLWDKALVILTADHGASFRVKPSPAPPFVPGKLGYHRDLTADNEQDIITVPLFVKYPGAESGGVDPTWGRTIDVLPTIADVLGIDLPFEVDGSSLRDKRPPPTEIEVRKTNAEDVVVDVARLQVRKDEALDHQLDLLGTTWAAAYRIGPHPELIGQHVDDVAQLPRGPLTAKVLDAGKFDDVDLGSPSSPTFVGGTLGGDESPEDHDLAFALSGTIVTTAVSFHDLGVNRLNFSSMLPPDAMRPGRNRLQIFEIAEDGRLIPLGGAGDE